jgi:hypothetical protein
VCSDYNFAANSIDAGGVGLLQAYLVELLVVNRRRNSREVPVPILD